MKKPYTEIRWHARGGQGAKTAATLVAEMAIDEGKYSQGFPEYGPERMGAPIRGFTRIGEKPITVHSSIYNPEIVVVLDDSLLSTVDVCEGLDEGGVVLVNTTRKPDEIRGLLSHKNVKLHTIDANKIALEEIGRAIPNAPMMGALAKVSGVVQLESIITSTEKKFGKKFSPKIVEGNVRAIKRAYEEVA
jgi:pyruvate ferredoxin oxidoreductase gamma subunit